MPWFILTTLATVLFGVCNVVDKFVLEKRIKNFLIYFVVGGFIWLIFALMIIFFLPPINASSTVIILALFGGLLTSATWLLFYKALAQEDVSRVISIYYIFPVLVAILARIFLGEKISWLKFVAIILSVCGAILISIKKEKVTLKFKLSNALLIIFWAALFEAGLEIIDKYVLSQISPWQVIVLSTFGYSMVAFLFFISSSKLRSEIARFTSDRATIKLVLLVHLIYFIATIIFLWAAHLAKITYVSAVSVTQPIFVFIFTALLSIFAPQIIQEPLSKNIVLVKAISIVLIIGGVLIIILT